jgi:hypothetical protein
MFRRIAAAAALAAAVFLAAQSLRADGQQSIASVTQDGQEAAEIVLPPQLETEKPATLAVLDREGRLAPNITVTLPGGKKIITDSTGRARFVVTSAPGPYVVEADAGVPNAKLQAISIVIAHPSTPLGGSSANVIVTSYPRIVALDDHIVVRGSGFRGDADLNRASLASQPTLVLASSPDSLVLQPGPAETLGLKDLIIEAGGQRSGPVVVTFVSLEITRPPGELAVGQRGELNVRVNGTADRVTLSVENLSGGAVGLLNGNVQRVTSTGGPQNLAIIPLRALRAGGFSISVRVVTAIPDAGTLALARSELVAARGAAAGAWARAIDHALATVDNAGPDLRGVPHLLDEIEKMLSGEPSVEVEKHLRAAWLELVRG